MMMDDSDDECIVTTTTKPESKKSTTASNAKSESLSVDTKPAKKTLVSARKNKFPDANPQLSLDELKARKTIDQLVVADEVKAIWSGAMASNYDPPLIGNQAQWMSKPDFAELAGGRVNDFKLPRLNSPYQFSQFTDTNSKLFICPFASMFIRSTGAPPVLYGVLVNEETKTLKMLIIMEGDNKFVNNMQYPIHSSLVNALACQLTMCLPKSICELNPAITQLLHLCSVHFKHIDMLSMATPCEVEYSHCAFVKDTGTTRKPDQVHTTALYLLEQYGYLDPQTKQPTDKKPTVELIMLQRLQPIMRSYAYDGFASLIKRDDSQDTETLINQFRTNPSIPFNGSTPFSKETNTFVPTLEDALKQIVEATMLLYSWEPADRQSETRQMTIQDAFSPFYNEVQYNHGKVSKAQKKSSNESNHKPTQKKRRINDDDDSEDDGQDSDKSYVEEDDSGEEGDSDEDDDSEEEDEEDEESGEDSDDGDSEDDDDDDDDDEKEKRKMVNRKYKKAALTNKNVSEEKLVRSEKKEAELQQMAIDAEWKEKEEFEAQARRADMARFAAKDGIGGLEIVPDHESESEIASDEDIDAKLERRLKSKKRKKRGSSEAGPSGAIPHDFLQMQQRLIQTQIEFMERVNKLIDKKL